MDKHQSLTLLKKHFPNCFDKNGDFIAAKFQEIIKESGAELSKESFSLNWLGKSYARLLAHEKNRTLLKPDVEHNSHPNNLNSQNLLIKGDNLEVLKHLRGAYSDQIKMIYIDPPYNTGSDGFLYEDDRKFTPEQLSDLAGIDEDEAKRVLEFTSSGSNSHSAWLTFIYPRLYVARQLLHDDGVIFISIDDNEQAQLKLLCDEIFGEENFVTQFVWKTRQASGKQVAQNNVSIEHEYILAYQKANPVVFFGVDRNRESYSNPDNDPRGDWAKHPLDVGSTQDERPNCFYTITDPSTGIKYEANPNRVWAFHPPSMEKLISENKIIFHPTGKTRPYLKKFWSELKTERKPISTWVSQDDFEIGYNAEGTKIVNELFDDVKTFDYPKPVSLLKLLIEQVTSENDYVVDFFAGSGTTAHAVMELNAEKNSDRKFICVQIDEITDPKSEAFKAGYKTIFDITQARISRAARKIQADYPNFVEQGFQIFETQPMFDRYLDSPEILTENLTLFDATELTSDQRNSLMRTWALSDNIKLNVHFTPLKLGHYTGYLANKTIYFVEPNVTLDALVIMLEKLDNDPDFAPNRLVVLGYLLDSKIQREITEAVHHYNNRKGIELTLDIRYS